MDDAGHVCPQTWCDGARVISMGCKEGLQLDIGKFAGLGQPIHATLYFNVDMSLVYQQPKVVVVNDLSRKDSHWDVHVCIVLSQHGNAQVKVFRLPIMHCAFCVTQHC